jgi:parallel beta-helix repeat protein
LAIFGINNVNNLHTLTILSDKITIVRKFFIKRSLVLFFVLISGFKAFSTNYYFSTSTGDDSRTSTQAQSPSTPWRTLSKLDSFFSNLQPGDSVLLKRGDTFDGSITISKSGTSGLPIVISGYGTGSKPIVNGFSTLTNWTNLGNGIWECAAVTNGGSNLNMLTINGTPYAMGRYPNADAPNKGYLLFQSHSGGGSTGATVSITSNQISGIPNFIGGEIVYRADQFILDRGKITSQTSTTVTFSAGSYYAPINNFGFFFQNSFNTLDKFGEWYYNLSTKKVDIFFGAINPSSYKIKATTSDVLVYGSYFKYITINNISFQGANTNGVLIEDNATNYTLRYCDISYCGEDGICGVSTTNLTVANCNISWSNDDGISLPQSSQTAITNHMIKSTSISNSGSFSGMGKSGDQKYCGISIYGSNNTIQNNIIKNSGYCGISHIWGNNVLIKNNYVDSFCTVKNDGGGIYTYNGNSGAIDYTGQRITGNIILYALHSNEGTPGAVIDDGWSHAIYLDDNSSGIEVSSNTAAYADRGLFIHNGHDINILNNTFYDNVDKGIDIDYDNSSAPNQLTRNIISKNNIFFAKQSNQLAAVFRSLNNDLASFGTFDSNYYCRPVAETNTIQTIVHQFNTGGSEVVTKMTLSNWQSSSGLDRHSKKTIVTISDANKIDLKYNKTSATKTITLNRSYLGIDGISHAGSINLAPYTSVILIDTSLTNIPSIIYYRDADNDGYGVTADTLMRTSQPAGYVTQSGDCNDSNASVHPGAEEICGNGIDDNCDGQIDEKCPLIPSLKINDVTVSSLQTKATLTVSVSSKSSQSINFNYATVNGTAVATKNYKSAQGTLTIPADSTSGLINVTLNKNNNLSGSLYFDVKINNPMNATIADSSGRVMIQGTALKSNQNPLFAQSGNFKNQIFAVNVQPNPATNYLNIIIHGCSSQITVLRISDVAGRVLEIKKLVALENSVIQMGNNLKPGFYIVEAMRGDEKVQIKVVKTA